MPLSSRVFFVVASLLAAGKSHLLQLGEGEVCKSDAGGGDWRCQLLANCPGLDPRKTRPAICSFRGMVPIICCAPSHRVALLKCLLYQMSSCDDGDQRGRFVRNAINVVVGGRKAKPKEHPHIALIGYGPENRKSWRCGGSLISERFVLSAAHCSKTYDMGPARWARLGELDYSTSLDDAQPKDFEIVERIDHPDYKPPAAYHDIALYKLASTVQFDYWIKPACLYTRPQMTAVNVTAAGWGRTDFAGKTSESLMVVDLPLVNTAECKRLLEKKTSSKIPNGIDAVGMICAGDLAGGKDTCSGDSGGPLLIDEWQNCLKFVIGVTSFGFQCALPNSPGVYTRIWPYVPWIEKIVWPES